MCKEIAEDVTRGPKHDAGEETIHVEMQNLMPTRDDDVSDDGWKQATDALLAAISRDAGGVGAAELWTRPYDEGQWTRRVVANFWQNFGKMLLVFGCIGADLCK